MDSGKVLREPRAKEDDGVSVKILDSQSSESAKFSVEYYHAFLPTAYRHTATVIEDQRAASRRRRPRWRGMDQNQEVELDH